MRASDALVPLVTVHQLTQWGSALVMHRDAPSPFSSSLSSGPADCPVASHFFWLTRPSPSLPHLSVVRPLRRASWTRAYWAGVFTLPQQS